MCPPDEPDVVAELAAAGDHRWVALVLPRDRGSATATSGTYTLTMSEWLSSRAWNVHTWVGDMFDQVQCPATSMNDGSAMTGSKDRADPSYDALD